MKFAIQIDQRAATLPRGDWCQTRGRYLEAFPELFTPAQALESVAAELGLTTTDPITRDHDVRIMVFAAIAAETPECEQVFAGGRMPAGPSRPAAPGELDARYAGTRTGVLPEALMLVPRRYARMADVVPAGGVPAIEGKAVPAPVAAPGVPAGGATDEPGFVVPGPARHVPGAVGGGPVPEPTPGGIDRPRVWLRSSAPPGRDVRAVLDGITTYHRTAADRWTPADQTGPGYAWEEIPAAVRVDATTPLAPAPAGHLAVDREGA